LFATGSTGTLIEQGLGVAIPNTIHGTG